DLQLLAGGQRRAGRLLPVAQRCVKYANVMVLSHSSTSCRSPVSLSRLHRHRIDKGHHLAQRCADLFDEMALLALPLGLEPGPALFVLGDPVARVAAVL